MNSFSHDQIDRRRWLAKTAALSAAAASTFPLWGGRHAFGQVQDSFTSPQLAVSPPEDRTNYATGETYAAATVHPIATAAAQAAFERGGNAFDAAIAASLILSVVDNHNSGLGGGAFALVRTADGRVMAFDARETAPALAVPTAFYSNGKPDPKLTQVGSRAAGTPGLIKLLHQIQNEFARGDWRESLDQAATIADEGFAMDSTYANAIASTRSQLQRFAASKAILLSDGKPPATGDKLVQHDLAESLRAIRDGGSDWFYHGPFAEQTDRWMQQNGGLLRKVDFSKYSVLQREPIQCAYRQHMVFGFPPPSSGGIHVAQMLGMLSRFPDLRSLDTLELSHLFLEVMKRAMADRVYWLGDSDFADVPMGLLNPDYLAQRSNSIDLESATSVDGHGIPPAGAGLFGREKHTTHLTTADRFGNIVALTQTLNTSFGSKVTIPGTGIMLNNQMDDFSIAPGVQNAYGLIGGTSNRIEPGKRPLSSMSPTIVQNQMGQPVFTCGAAGGPKILTTALQLTSRAIDLAQDAQSLISAPRVHHQWSPDIAYCEAVLGDDVLNGLRDFGHKVQVVRANATAQAIQFHSSGLSAATDPRVASSAYAN